MPIGQIDLVTPFQAGVGIAQAAMNLRLRQQQAHREEQAFQMSQQLDELQRQKAVAAMQEQEQEKQDIAKWQSAFTTAKADIEKKHPEWDAVKTAEEAMAGTFSALPGKYRMQAVTQVMSGARNQDRIEAAQERARLILEERNRELEVRTAAQEKRTAVAEEAVKEANRKNLATEAETKRYHDELTKEQALRVAAQQTAQMLKEQDLDLKAAAAAARLQAQGNSEGASALLRQRRKQKESKPATSGEGSPTESGVEKWVRGPDGKLRKVQ